MKPNGVILVTDEELCSGAKKTSRRARGATPKTIKAETDTTIKSAFICLRTVCLTNDNPTCLVKDCQANCGELKLGVRDSAVLTRKDGILSEWCGSERA